MDSAQLQDLVSGHRPADEREAMAKERFLDELGRLDHPCDEHADPVHVTGSAVVVGVRGTVLHRHRRLGRWMQPGGHLEPGEAPWQAARREAEEETGLVLAHPPEGPWFLQLDVHEAALGHTHLDLRYLLLASPKDPVPPEGESPDAARIEWDQAQAVVDGDPALAAGIVAARERWQARGDAWLRVTEAL